MDSVAGAESTLAVVGGKSEGLNRRFPGSSITGALGLTGHTAIWRLYSDRVVVGILPRYFAGKKPSAVDVFELSDILGCSELDGERERTQMERRTSGGLLGALSDASNDRSVHSLRLVTPKGDVEILVNDLGERRQFILQLDGLLSSIHQLPPPVSPVVTTDSEVPAQLERLASLREQGLLTDDEFSAAKSKWRGA